MPKVDVSATQFNIDNIPDAQSYSGKACAHNLMCRRRTMPDPDKIAGIGRYFKPIRVLMIHGFVVTARKTGPYPKRY